MLLRSLPWASAATRRNCPENDHKWESERGLRCRKGRNDADRRLSVFLHMHGVRDNAAVEAGSLHIAMVCEFSTFTN